MEKYGKLNDHFPGEVGFLKTADGTMERSLDEEKSGIRKNSCCVVRIDQT